MASPSRLSPLLHWAVPAGSLWLVDSCSVLLAPWNERTNDCSPAATPTLAWLQSVPHGPAQAFMPLVSVGDALAMHISPSNTCRFSADGQKRYFCSLPMDATRRAPLLACEVRTSIAPKSCTPTRDLRTTLFHQSLWLRAFTPFPIRQDGWAPHPPSRSVGTPKHGARRTSHKADLTRPLNPSVSHIILLHNPFGSCGSNGPCMLV